MMVVILQLKASKLIAYFVSFTVAIFTILHIIMYIRITIILYEHDYSAHNNINLGSVTML